MNTKTLLSALGLTTVIFTMTSPTNAVNQQVGITEAQLCELSNEAESETKKAEVLKAKNNTARSATVINPAEIRRTRLTYGSQKAKALIAAAKFAESAAQLIEQAAETHELYITKLPERMNPCFGFMGPEWVIKANTQTNDILRRLTANGVHVQKEIMEAADEVVEIALKNKLCADMHLKCAYSSLERATAKTLISEQEVARREVQIRNSIAEIAIRRLEVAKARRQALIATTAASLLY